MHQRASLSYGCWESGSDWNETIYKYVNIRDTYHREAPHNRRSLPRCIRHSSWFEITMGGFYLRVHHGEDVSVNLRTWSIKGKVRWIWSIGKYSGLHHGGLHFYVVFMWCTYGERERKYLKSERYLASASALTFLRKLHEKSLYFIIWQIYKFNSS